MFSTAITIEDVEKIEEFLFSDDCHFVEDMNKAGLSFGAMALVLESISKELARVKEALNEEE